MAWGAAKHVLKSAPPVQMVRQLSHNLDLASTAVTQVGAGDYGLALCTMLKMPYEGALGAASIITGPIEAAIEVPDMVRTAIDAADPEVKGAAAVQALQDIATVGLTVVAVGQAVKGPGGSATSQSPKGAAHANHLDSPKPARGYSLRDVDTGAVLKYGETTRGEARYSQGYLNENNAKMWFEANGTKREMHQWQHDRILDYKSQNGGQRPPLNKSDY
jgi:hypothetical protein